MQNPIKILIADDHPLVRKGLVALLDDRQDMIVVGEAADGFEVVTLAEKLTPDVILMDLEMPGQDGIVATRKIKGAFLNSKILVLTSFTDQNRVISAIRSGVDGFMLKTTMPHDLIRAILDIRGGRKPLDPTITGTVLKELSQDDQASSNDVGELSEREITVLALIAKGCTNRQIGIELDISERTVSTHVSHIFEKLKVENRTQAALYALRSGLVSIESE